MYGIDKLLKKVKKKTVMTPHEIKRQFWEFKLKGSRGSSDGMDESE